MTPNPNDPFSGFLILMARLWRARWLILASGFLLAVVTFVNLKFLTPETFRSDAVLYLAEDIQAPTITTLVTSTNVLDIVRARFRDKFPDAYGIRYMDDFSRRFNVDEQITEDNSLRKTYSPALVLSADAHSPKQAQTLMTIWLEEIVTRFGGMSGLEARFRSENGRLLIDQLKQAEQETMERRTALDLRATELEARLRDLIRLLSPANILTGQKTREFTAYVEGLLPKQQHLAFEMLPSVAPREPGLIEQQIRIQTQLARNSARLEVLQTQQTNGKEETAKAILELQAEIAALNAEEAAIARQIGRAQDDISSLSTILQKLKADLAAADTELASLRLQQDFAGSQLAHNVSAGFLSQQHDAVGAGEDRRPARLDFTVATQPSFPDRKIAPKRIVNAILAAFLGCFFACFVVAFTHFIEQLPRLSKGNKS